MAGVHGWQGTLPSDRAGICDRQNCGGPFDCAQDKPSCGGPFDCAQGRQAGEWCRLRAYYNISVQFVNQCL